MNVLGSLFVELKANTAHWVEGLSKASYEAKRFSHDVEESFGRLGGLVGTALAPFGEVGAIIGESFGRIGEWGSKASEGLAEMSGGMRFLTVGAGAGVAAIAALEAGAIGLAIHATEGAAKMLLLAQAAGVSVETFSGLAFAAKMVGIDQDTLAKNLEKLDKAVLKNATSGPKAVDAFTRLHVSVRDAAGAIKPTEEILLELADKFSKMENGAIKSGLAMQIFGKGGATMLPLLNEGRQGVQDFIETAQAFGLVIDTDTAEAAHHFRQQLETLESAGTGVANKFMKELLPAINFLADAMVDWLKKNSDSVDAFVAKVSWMVRQSIAHVYEFVTILRQVGLFFDALAAESNQLGLAMHDAIKGGITGGVGGAIAGAYDGLAKMGSTWQKFSADSGKIWENNRKFVDNVLNPPEKKYGHEATVRAEADLKPAKEDTTARQIQERIDKLALEAANWLKVGEAGTQAEQLIAEAMKKGDEEFGTLKEKAAKDKSGSLAMDIVLANEAKIKGAEATAVYGAAIKAVTGELDKQHEKYIQEAAAARGLAEAYASGGIAGAVLDSMLADQSAKVQVLVEAHDRLRAKYGDTNPQVIQLAAGVELETKKLKENKDALEAVLQAKLDVELAKEIDSFAALRPYVAAVADAHLLNAAAVRDANVELQLQTWIQSELEKGIQVTDDQIAKQRALLAQKSEDSYRDSIKEEARRHDLLGSYQDEITKLEDVRKVLQATGDSTLLVDAAIYDANDKLIRQWDAAALKVGTLGDKFRAMLNEVALAGNNLSGKIFEAFGKAIDDVSTQLAKLVVTGKSNFKELFQSLEESIAKAGFQKIIGGVAGFINNKLFGGAIPGLGQKADGSSNSPFYVIPVDKSGGVLGGLGGGGGLWGGSATSDNGGIWDESIPGLGGQGAGAGGLGGIFDGLFSKIESIFSSLFGGIFKFFGSIFSGLGGGLSSIFSGLGFLANGGPVTPGRAYIVGEKHPEFFVPRQAGDVVPTLQMGTQQTQVVIHVHGVKDADSFRRSESQIMARYQQQLAHAYARSR